MTQYRLNINGDNVQVDCQENTPLLWVLRDHLQLTGTRFGCGSGLCGACTVLINGVPVHSCDTPIWSVGAKLIQTIENEVNPTLSKVKAGISSGQAGQCGFCLSGIMMRASALIDSGVELTRHSVSENLDGHLCRCGAHNRIIDAVITAGS
ncbi:MAG: 2Fe-2S iron-sulfur cluster-binding protein [Candidatus Nanopelagicaceae bacterium]|nr:2Fe-2S iron-sulfur cluster-binding protein [Candidatus Nanopelagicaceae bacterium]